MALIPLVLVFSVLVSGCRSSASSSSSGMTPKTCGVFKKVKVAAQTGVAYVAFKRYLYAP